MPDRLKTAPAQTVPGLMQRLIDTVVTSVGRRTCAVRSSLPAACPHQTAKLVPETRCPITVCCLQDGTPLKFHSVGQDFFQGSHYDEYNYRCGRGSGDRSLLQCGTL